MLLGRYLKSDQKDQNQQWICSKTVLVEVSQNKLQWVCVHGNEGASV